MTLRVRPDWYDLAACKGMNPDLFHPVAPSGPPPEAVEACQRCVVRRACLDHAVTFGEKLGLWGGQAAEQRRRKGRPRRDRQLTETG